MFVANPKLKMNMKLKFYTLFLLTFIIMSSCDKSSTDEFEDANGDVAVRLLENITVISAQDASDNDSVNFYYDGNGRLTKVSSVEASNLFYYDNGKLSEVKGDGDAFSVEELFKSPYDAFETGEVLEYDSNSNPKRIKFFEEDYDYVTDSYFNVEYTADLFYDSKPNPYFYTMKAGGIIDALDKIKLNFQMSSQPSKLVQARMLLPVNNISKIEYRDNEGQTVATIRVDYAYDSTNYPTSATVTILSDGDIDSYTLNYSYK